MQFVGDKVAYALAQGLKVVTACVGETLQQRKAGSTKYLCNNAGSTDKLLRESTYGHAWPAAVLPD
jgi:triosephosphate isomerase